MHTNLANSCNTTENATAPEVLSMQKSLFGCYYLQVHYVISNVSHMSHVLQTICAIKVHQSDSAVCDTDAAKCQYPSHEGTSQFDVSSVFARDMYMF